MNGKLFWLLVLPAVMALAGSGYWLTQELGAARSQTAAQPLGNPKVAAPPRTQGLAMGEETAGAPAAPRPTQAPAAGRSAIVPGLPTLPTAPDVLVASQGLSRLGNLPAGDDAIDVGRQLEAGIGPHNEIAYVDALLRTTSPAVERIAMTALARAGSSAAIQALGHGYGAIAPELRGRVLQVLERAANPDALPGLQGIVAADSGEKRSPLAMSALYGMARIGTAESVSQLLELVANPAYEDFALMALERVSTQQGVAMVRAAAQGAKGSEKIISALRPALLRAAEAAEAALPR